MFAGIVACDTAENAANPAAVQTWNDAGVQVNTLTALATTPDAPLPCRFSVGAPTGRLEIHALSSAWVVDEVNDPSECPGRGYWIEGGVLTLCPGSCAVVAEDEHATVRPHR